MDDKSLTNTELETLAAEVGEFIRYWGFKQIHGRIWTFLFVSSTPLDASSLMKRLKVSKALMSLSLKDLLHHKVIKEAKRSQRGTHTYVANPNILEIITGILRDREKAMLDRIENAQRELESLPAEKLNDSGINTDRLRLLGDLIRHAQTTLDDLLTMSGEFRSWLDISKTESVTNQVQ
jgi:DNA-binding transcriptional regulator GbsR (MarR family)